MQHYTLEDVEKMFGEGFTLGITHRLPVKDSFKETMEKVFPKRELGPVTLDVLIKFVADKYKILEEDFIFMRTRKRRFVYPRKIVIFLAYFFTVERLQDIGAMLGNIGHSSISTSIKSMTEEAEVNKQIRSAIQDCVSSLINKGYTFDLHNQTMGATRSIELPEWLQYEY